MEEAYLILNLDQNRCVSGKDDAGNINLNRDARMAKAFDSKESAKAFLESCNGSEKYYTIIEAFFV